MDGDVLAAALQGDENAAHIALREAQRRNDWELGFNICFAVTAAKQGSLRELPATRRRGPENAR